MNHNLFEYLMGFVGGFSFACAVGSGAIARKYGQAAKRLGMAADEWRLASAAHAKAAERVAELGRTRSWQGLL